MCTGAHNRRNIMCAGPHDRGKERRKDHPFPIHTCTIGTYLRRFRKYLKAHILLKW